jgi:hypothetical protein
LTLLNHITLFVSDIDGQMFLVLVDSQIKHDGYSLGLKVCKIYFTLRDPHRAPLRYDGITF